MNAELSPADQRTLTTSLLKLSKLLFECSNKFDVDNLIKFNDLLQQIENINANLNRQLCRKMKRYQITEN